MYLTKRSPPLREPFREPLREPLRGPLRIRLSTGFCCCIVEAHIRLRKVNKTSFGIEDFVIEYFVSFIDLVVGFVVLFSKPALDVESFRRLRLVYKIRFIVRLSRGLCCLICEAHIRLRKVYKTSFGIEDFLSLRLSRGVCCFTFATHIRLRKAGPMGVPRPGLGGALGRV